MNNNLRKIGLIWANLQSTNLGVSALAYSALVIFEEISKRRNLKFEYILWGGGKTDNRSINIRNHFLDIKERKAFNGGDWIRYIKNFVKRPWTFYTYKYLKELRECDILADIGEGDSYADIYGIERFRNFDYIKKKFHKSGKPYILLPQTIGPFESTEARAKAKISLESAAYVFARDRQSYKFCQQIAPNTNLLESIDMAFFLPYNKKKFTNTKKKNVGINVSGLLWEGGYTRNNQFGLKTNYQRLIYKLIEYLIQQPNIDIHLIGHVIGRDKSLDDDGHALKILHKHFPKSILAPIFKSPIEAKSYISGMDFFTGARMHACIAAISSGVAVLPMAYSRKFNGLFTETLNYNYIVDLKTSDENEALNLFISAFGKLEMIEQEINQINKYIIEIEKERCT